MFKFFKKHVKGLMLRLDIKRIIHSKAVQWITLFVTILAAIGYIKTIVLAPLPDDSDKVSEFELHEKRKSIKVLNSKGETINKLSFNCQVVEPIEFRYGDSNKEIFVVTGGKGRKLKHEDTGVIMIFDANGDTVWRYDTYNVLRRKKNEASSEFFSVDTLMKASFFGHDDDYVLAIVHDPNQSISKILIIDPGIDVNDHKRIMYNFWNPGRIQHKDNDIIIKDFDSDGKNEVLLTGWNNTLAAQCSDSCNYADRDSFYFAVTMLLEPVEDNLGYAPGLEIKSNKKYDFNSLKWYIIAHPFMKTPELGVVEANFEYSHATLNYKVEGIKYQITNSGKLEYVMQNAKWTTIYGNEFLYPVNIRFNEDGTYQSSKLKSKPLIKEMLHTDLYDGNYVCIYEELIDL
jgi:hypothetical protein